MDIASTHHMLLSHFYDLLWEDPHLAELEYIQSQDSAPSSLHSVLPSDICLLLIRASLLCGLDPHPLWYRPKIRSRDWTLAICTSGNIDLAVNLFRRTPHSEKSLLLQHLCASDSVECISALYSLGLLDTVTITSGIILEAAYRQGYQPVWISQSPYVRWEDTFRLAVQYDLIHHVLHWAPDRVGTVEWRDSYADGIVTATVTHDLESYRAMVAQWGVEIEAEDILRVAGELDAYDWVRSFVEGWKDCSCEGDRCQTVSLYYQLGGQYDADAISYLYAHSTPSSSVERYLRSHYPDLTYCDHLHYRLHYYHPLLHTITANRTDYYYHDGVLCSSTRLHSDRLSLYGRSPYHYYYIPLDASGAYSLDGLIAQSRWRVGMGRKKSARAIVEN